jgi:hypothetical protein
VKYPATQYKVEHSHWFRSTLQSEREWSNELSEGTKIMRQNMNLLFYSIFQPNLSHLQIRLPPHVITKLAYKITFIFFSKFEPSSQKILIPTICWFFDMAIFFISGHHSLKIRKQAFCFQIYMILLYTSSRTRST